jgi:hypothetical protein
VKKLNIVEEQNILETHKKTGVVELARVDEVELQLTRSAWITRVAAVKYLVVRDDLSLPLGASTHSVGVLAR